MAFISLCNFLEEVFSTLPEPTIHFVLKVETGACMADFVVERRNVDFHVVAETFTKYVLKVVLFKPDRISWYYELCVSL